MQNRHNANITKFKNNKMQMKQNANMTMRSKTIFGVYVNRLVTFFF